MTALRPRGVAVCATAFVLVLSGCGSSPSASAGGGQGHSPGASASPSSPAGTPSPGGSQPAGAAVPAGFVPASVTFVSLQTGLVLGTAPCSSSSTPCLAMLRTSDSGQSWTSVPAPPTSLASNTNPSGHGVHQVRFADQQDGWVFGPELWATHDGGTTWTRISLPAVSASAAVVDLAAAGGTVHAAVFDGRVDIASSPVDHDGWSLSPTTIPFGAGPIPRAQLVLHAGAGWLIEVDRTVVGGARLSAGQWSPWGPPCHNAGGDAILDAVSVSDLFAVCNEGVWNGGTPITHAYRSSDGGNNFTQAPAALPVGNADEVASGAPSTAVVAAHSNGGGINELLRTGNGGVSWSVVYHSGGTVVANDLGFTSAQQGVVVQTDGAAAQLLMTFDGGQTWGAVTFR